MIESKILNGKLERTFGLYDCLLEAIDDQHLQADLKGLPSNTLGSQMWCVIGARQSYLRAILAGGWQGFKCSLAGAETGNRLAVREHMQISARDFLSAMEKMDSMNPAQQSLLFDLIEHEAQHQGQIIRYLYALKIQIPEVWKKRYSLS
jgi:hypothetical protein